MMERDNAVGCRQLRVQQSIMDIVLDRNDQRRPEIRELRSKELQKLSCDEIGRKGIPNTTKAVNNHQVDTLLAHRADHCACGLLGTLVEHRENAHELELLANRHGHEKIEGA